MFGILNRVKMCLVLFELGPDQKLEETQDSSLKCLGQPAQISLDSAVLAVRPLSQIRGECSRWEPSSHLHFISGHRCRVLCFVQFRHVASKLNCFLFSCCVDYALMYDMLRMRRILIATCSGCFV